jgi:hypothetical protein
MTASRLRIVADRRHGLSRATLYFRKSAENQQISDSSPEASRPLQPPRHLSSGIRPTEQTACCPPASSDSSSLTRGCDRSSQNQEQCTAYTSKKRPRRDPWHSRARAALPSGRGYPNPKGGAVYQNVRSRLPKLKLSDDDRLSRKKLKCRLHPVWGISRDEGEPRPGG